MKVLEAIEEKDRLILSNKKTAFETNKKLSYTVRLAPPLAHIIADQWKEHCARQWLSNRGFCCIHWTSHA